VIGETDAGWVWIRNVNNMGTSIASGAGYGTVIDVEYQSSGNILVSDVGSAWLRTSTLASTGYSVTGYAAGGVGIGDFAIQSNDKMIMAYELGQHLRGFSASFTQQLQTGNDYGYVNEVAVQPDDDVICGNTAGGLWILAAADLSEIASVTLDGAVGDIISMADGTVVAGSENGTLYVKSGTDLSTLGSLSGLGQISAIAVQSDGDIVVGTWDGTLSIYGFDGSSFILKESDLGYGNITDIVVVTNLPAPLPPVPSCEEQQNAGLTDSADINGDCYVDLVDFSLLAYKWLN
jgi:hypothetical protein